MQKTKAVVLMTPDSSKQLGNVFCSSILVKRKIDRVPFGFTTCDHHTARVPPELPLRYDSSMQTSLAHWTVGMVMFFTITPIAGGGRSPTCLPDGIKPDTVVSSERVRSAGGTTIRKVTVS